MTGDEPTTEGRVPCPAPPVWAGALAAGAVAALVSVNTVANGYVSDDFLNILQNPWVLDPLRTHEAFSNDFAAFDPRFQTGLYRPMTFALHAAWVWLWGLRAPALHLLSVLLHAGVTSCVYVLLARWTPPGACGDPAGPGSGAAHAVSRWSAGPMFGALLFAVHPIHTENVAWLSDLTDLGCALFFLLAFLAATAAAVPPWVRALVAAPCFLAATMFKEPGTLVLPLVLVAFIVRGDLRDSVRRRGAVTIVAALSLALAVYFAMRVHALGGLAPGTRRMSLSLAEISYTPVTLVGAYLAKLALPLHLSPVHDFATVTNLADPRLWLGAASLCLLAFVLWKGRRTPAVALGGALLLLPLLPALYLPGVGKGLLSERYLYLPSAGAMLLASVGWNRWSTGTVRTIAVRAPAAAALIIVAGVATIQQNAVWRDSLTLWSDTARKQPRIAVVFEYLGFAQLSAGDPAGAVQSLSRALHLDPTCTQPRVNLASALVAAGRPEEGLAQAVRAVGEQPRLAEPYVILGNALSAMGRTHDAIPAYARAVSLRPAWATAHHLLGVAYLEIRRPNLGVPHLREAVRLDPNNSRFAQTLEAAGP